MFKRIPLRAKLSIPFILITLLVAAVGLYQLQTISQVGSLFNDLTGNDSERKAILSDLKVTSHQLESTLLRYNQQTTHTDTEKNAISLTVDNYKQTLETLYEEYNKNLEGNAAASVDKGVRSTFKNNIAILVTTAKQYTAAAHTRSVALVNVRTQELAAATDRLDKDIVDIAQIEVANTRTETAETKTNLEQLLRIVFLVIGGVALFALLFGLLGITMINSSLKRLKQGAQRIANGDFSKRLPVESGDEIGQVAIAFNNMAIRLSDSYRRLSVETERNKILLESLGEGVIAVDEKGRIVLINDPAMLMLELASRDDIIGLQVDKAVALLNDKAEPLPEDDMPLIHALKTGEPVRGNYKFQKKSDAKIIIDIVANPVKVEGKTVAAIMNLRDVTKEREIDRMKTEFISLASHQLRTPLSAIRWFSEMLLSGDAGKLKPDQAEFARNISDSTERMIALVNALLNISRIESGRIMIDPKPTDLKELVSGIVNDLKGKTSEKQQNLIISVHADLPKINLDPRLIGQVYLNLLTNAIKYTQKGGEISVFISKKDDQIISQVADNGYGIPKEQQGRIFQKFFRASNAAKVETDGTGLGLYLIKAVVESSGGKIWFASEEGKGTTFWFSIPLSGMKRKEGEVTLDI